MVLYNNSSDSRDRSDSRDISDRSYRSDSSDSSDAKHTARRRRTKIGNFYSDGKKCYEIIYFKENNIFKKKCDERENKIWKIFCDEGILVIKTNLSW